MMSHMMEIAEE